jgi:membrane-associated protease RseP (regulator of RpoE activity)
MARLDRQRCTIRAAAIGAAVLLAACAAPAPVAPNTGARVEAIAAQRCAEAIPRLLGAEVATVHDFRPADRARAASVLGFDQTLRIVAVDAGSPADAAGLRPGDIVEAVDGATVPAGARARQAFLAAAADGDGAPALRVRRDGHAQVVHVPGRVSCTTSVQAPVSVPRS